MLASFFMLGETPIHRVLASFLSGEFLLAIPCWLHFYLAMFSYTSRAGFSLLSGELLLNISCWLHFYVGNFSYTSHAGFFFSSGEFLLNIPCWLHFDVGSSSYTSRADLVFVWGVSLTHPMLALYFCGQFLLHSFCWLLFLIWVFLLHIPCCPFFFYLGSFSYTSHVCFISLWRVSLTRPMLAGWLAFYFLFFILFFNLGSFSSSSYAGLIFM